MSIDFQLNNLDITFLASQASNLEERLNITQSLDRNNAEVNCIRKQLDEVDRWELEQILQQLSLPFIKNQVYKEEKFNFNTALSIENLKDLLIQYKIYELNLDNLSELELTEFRKPHFWLKTYQSALENMIKSPLSTSGTIGEKDVYYGRFAKTIEPFLTLVAMTLEKVGYNLLNEQIIADIQLNLLNRLEYALAGAISADLSLYCYTKKIAKSFDTQGYLDYFDRTFEDIQGYHQFFCRFPVLARWTATLTEFTINNSLNLLTRLNHDRQAISDLFCDGKSISKIKSLQLGKSDPHAGGQTVVFIELELDNSQTTTIVYKPRCVKAEAGMQIILKTLSSEQVIDLPTYHVLCQDDYGYCEFISPGQNQVETLEAVERFYYQIGAYLAIFYILGGSDLHYENILVNQGNAYICDCETIFDVILHGMKPQYNTVFDSVYKTGMLDWPRANKEQNNNSLKIGGIQGGESYETPFSSPQIKHRMTLALSVENEEAVYIEGKTTNRLYYKGQLINPQDHCQAIVDGFNQVYSWMLNNSSKISDLIQEVFQTSSVRFVNRATQVYAKVFEASRHPKCLIDPLQVDLVLQSLIEHQRAWDATGELANLEIKSLWQCDIPLFTALSDSQQLVWK